MFIYENKKNTYIFEIALYSLLLFIKLVVFHHYIDIENRNLLVSILNLLTALSIFIFISYCFRKRRREVLLGTYTLLTSLIFFNSLYYSHFFTLIPINAIYQLGHLSGVSSSVKTLLKLAYFLYFLDLPILVYMYFKNKDCKAAVSKPRKPGQLAWMLLIFMCIFIGNQQIKTAAGGFYTPFNMGIYNYHIFDIYRLFGKGSPFIDNADAWMEKLEDDDLASEEIKYTGLLKDKNIIVIQAESFQSFVLNKEVNGQEITPVLNELLAKDSFYFSRYYEQVGWGNTSDAEFVTHNGLHASTINFSYKQYEGKQLNSLPMMLSKLGYQTIVFHGNEPDFWNRKDMYPTIGFEKFMSSEDLDMGEVIGMGLSDSSLFKQALSRLKELPQPFYSFFITLTSHYPYEMEEQHKKLRLDEPYNSTIIGDYLQTVNYLDTAIGELIEGLKESGLYENTAIIIYGDHHGLDARNEEVYELMTSFLGKPYREDEMYRVPMIIHIPNSGINKEVETVGGQIDFYPTISNLLALDKTEGVIIGKDLLNTKEGFAVHTIHTGRGSFIDDEKMFIISKDGIFENSRGWDIRTGEAIPLEKAKEGYERAIAEIYLSEYIIENILSELSDEATTRPQHVELD